MNFTWKSTIRNLMRYKKTFLYDDIRNWRLYGTDAGWIWSKGFGI